MIKQIVELWSGKSKSTKLTGDDYQLLQAITANDEVDEKVAYAAMLLEVATIDGKLDPKEEAIVARAIKDWFRLSQSEAWDTLTRGKQVLKSFRPGSSFVKRIRKQYTNQEREYLLNTIQQIISADGIITDEEKFIAERLRKLLS